MKPYHYSVAVIIPAHNAENTLRCTVESVLNQTLQDIEVIIVDDGSTDETSIIADFYAENDDRVRVIHQSNSGSYAARLAGLKISSASYFGFVDADDIIKPSMYEILFAHAVKYDLDVVQCEVAGKCQSDQAFEMLDETSFKLRILRPILLQGYGAAVVWDKIYRNQYNFNQFQDFDFIQWDDQALNLYFFRAMHRYGIVHEGLYDYNNLSATSVTHQYNPKTLKWFSEIIKLRRHIATRYYGMTKYDDAIWVMRTARNLFVMMSYVKFPSFATRYKSISQLIGSQDLRNAYLILKSGHLLKSRTRLFWFFAFKYTLFTMMVLFVLKRFQRYLIRYCEA